MTERTKLEVWIVLDENGDYTTGTTKDDAVERYGDCIGISGPLAVYGLSVDVPIPEPRTAEITLADDAPVEIIATVQE
ncbi:MAG: hypothetical protein ACYC4U_10235 [Pirellulaceae bacterium]